MVKDNWWESCSCISRVFSKRDNIPLKETIDKLDAYKDQGIGCIEIFAPYHGGNEYGSLDPFNFYIVDPAIGVMADFLELVDQCHNRDMAVIIFINVGYAAMENGDFLKAQDDVKRGIDSRESRFFLWSDTSDAVNNGSLSCSFDKKAEGYWQYSERAGKYYWVKWRGFNEDAALPQYNFGSHEWREECKKIIRFWMDTGIDGMIIDAPYSYANCNINTNNECITDIIREYPNKYIQPEGGGAADEDILRWITDAKYNSLQDYSLYAPWYKRCVVQETIFSGDTAALEATLNGWRDKLAQVNAVSYLGARWNEIEITPEQRLLEIAAIITTGAIFHDDNMLMRIDIPDDIRTRLAILLKLCASASALKINGERKVLIAENGIYAFIRINKNDRVIIFLNFSNESKTASVDLGILSLKNLISGEQVDCTGKFTVALNACGFEIFEMII